MPRKHTHAQFKRLGFVRVPGHCLAPVYVRNCYVLPHADVDCILHLPNRDGVYEFYYGWCKPKKFAAAELLHSYLVGRLLRKGTIA